MKSRLMMIATATLLPLIGTAGSALAQAPLPPHYQCYQVLKPQGFRVPPPVILRDQFGTRDGIKLGPPLWLCAPTIKNNEDKELDLKGPHLLCYADRWQRPVGPRVAISNQFGTGTFIVGQPGLFCVPSKKEVLK